MLLRKLTQHVKEQNWFAVGLDLVIVVVGVFIGIQVANWNDIQKDKAGLAASLERLDKEVSQNIDIIEEVLTNIEDGRERLDQSLEAMNDCAFSADAEAALELTLWDLVEDVQPNFANVALDQLARNDRYQVLLSPTFQDDIGFYTGRLMEENEQLTSHYDNMWSHHVNHHPDISAFFSADTEKYEGWGFKLDRPVAEICDDASFRNRFINTVGFYTSINTRLIRFREEAEKFKAALEKERKRS